MNILITGANGQLGCELRVVMNSTQHRYCFTDIEELDISDNHAVEAYVAGNNTDVIINCAAYTNVDGAEDNWHLADLLNNKAVKNMAKVARKAGTTLIHISTDYVLGGDVNIPYKENQPTNPLGVYGRTKLDGELGIQEVDCNYIIIRTSWLYSKFGNNFVKTIRKLISERDQLNVVFDQTGTPTYAADLAMAINYIINTGQLSKKGIYNFSNEGACSWYDFAMEIAALSGNKCDIQPCYSKEFPGKVKRPDYSVLDKTKIKNTFNITIPHWKESLVRCIDELNK